MVWLNRMAAETLFPDADPLGQFVYVGGEARQVVGVVEDTPFDPRGAISRITYVPHAQYAGNRDRVQVEPRDPVVYLAGGFTPLALGMAAS